MAAVVLLFPACPVKEGMESRTIIPDDFLTANPESDTVKNVRPGQPGQYTEDADKQPTISVRLVPDEDEPVPMGIVKLTGNMPSFTILYLTPEGKETPVTKPGSEEPQVRR